MTETTRTTVTLSEFNMSLVEDLIGILGTTRAQVISKIVEKYLQNEENIVLLEKLQAIKLKKEKDNKNEQAREPDVIDKKIKNLISGTPTITIETFLDYLIIDIEFFYDHLFEWKESYNMKVDNQIIKFSQN